MLEGFPAVLELENEIKKGFYCGEFWCDFNMAADLPIEQVMGNLKIDPYMNPNLDGKGSLSDATSCISSIGDASGSVKESELDYEPLALPYSPANYCEYYYPGYECCSGGVDDQGYYVCGDGFGIQYPVMVADNGSLVCFMPGFQPGYNPYTPYLPMTTIGVDGQYVGQQPSPLSPMFSPSIASPAYFPTHIPYGSEPVPSSYMWNPSYLVGDRVYGNGYAKVSDTPSSKLSASGHTRAPSKPTSESRNALENKGVSPVLDISSEYGVRHQLKGLTKPTQHGATFQPDSVQTKGSSPFTNFPSYHQGKGGLLFPNTPVNLKTNGRGCGDYEKLKTRSNTNGISDLGLVKEQSNGPGTANAKNALVSTDDTAASLDAYENKNNNSSASPVGREQYNLTDFPTKYNHAFFFVIKSYSEDDIHKSIKYNVWASTPNGNKRLDSAYQEAQVKMEEKVSKCPVFLFFSVNASGQFCGVAEMLGRVDFNRSMDFWQQDKWNGYFPVKWHIIKDVSNPQLRHIILENNENKPVTNSRDTQEVRFPQGIEMLSIFKNYVSKTSILDDFEFYESRQKVMQDKRIRPSTLHFDVVQQKADELNHGFQVMDVPTDQNIDEIRVGDKAND